MCQTLTVWVENKGRQRKGADHLDILRRQQHLLPVQAVSKHTTEEGKEHDRQLPQEQIQSEIEGISGEIVDQPALCKLLHKRAYGRNTSSQPHDPKITVPKRSEDAIQKGRGFNQESWAPFEI